jgi:hypothetical protein
MTESDQTVGAPVFKIATAWAAVGITSWAEAASFVAFFYTLLLIFEWFWKKFWRPIFERRGWVRPKKVRDSRPGDL